MSVVPKKVDVFLYVPCLGGAYDVLLIKNLSIKF